MALEDKDLIARVVESGDHHAFSVLVRRHQSPVRALLRRLCAGDHATADDLAQEVFIRAYDNLHQFRADAKLGSWLYRIAYNTFLAHRRSPARAEEPTDVVEDGLAQSGPSTLARHDVHRAFEHLRDEERAALALTFGRDLSHQEAAEILGWPLGTLKNHVRTGKEKLRTLLSAWGPEGATA